MQAATEQRRNKKIGKRSLHNLGKKVVCSTGPAVEVIGLAPTHD